MRRVADLAVKTVPTESLKPYAGNARAHSKKQVSQIARSMKVYGWTVPILVDADRTVIAGHGRLEAAKSLGLDQVPIITIDDLTPEQVKALRLADNKIAENARWDEDLLKVELDTLIAADLDFEITDTGFEMAELDMILADLDPQGPQRSAVDASDGQARRDDRRCHSRLHQPVRHRARSVCGLGHSPDRGRTDRPLRPGDGDRSGLRRRRAAPLSARDRR